MIATLRNLQKTQLKSFSLMRNTSAKSAHDYSLKKSNNLVLQCALAFATEHKYKNKTTK